MGNIVFANSCDRDLKFSHSVATAAADAATPTSLPSCSWCVTAKRTIGSDQRQRERGEKKCKQLLQVGKKFFFFTTYLQLQRKMDMKIVHFVLFVSLFAFVASVRSKDVSSPMEDTQCRKSNKEASCTRRTFQMTQNIGNVDIDKVFKVRFEPKRSGWAQLEW